MIKGPIWYVQSNEGRCQLTAPARDLPAGISQTLAPIIRTSFSTRYAAQHLIIHTGLQGGFSLDREAGWGPCYATSHELYP